MRLVALAMLVAACGDNRAATPDAAATSDAPACGRAGAITGVVDGTITVAGVERGYVLAVPASYDPARPYPLIFAWHGRGGSGTLARQYFHLEDVAGDEAIVVYPHGLPVTADPGDTGWELAASGRDIALFDALEAELAAGYCVGRVYSVGHSLGGYMTNALACARGGRVRAIASIAGGGPYTACSGDPVSAIIIHGQIDQVVPITEGERSRNTWRAAAGCGLTATSILPAPCIAYDGCDHGLVVRFCAHNEPSVDGHAWPPFAAAAAWRVFLDTP